jgi:hypothetical protein
MKNPFHKVSKPELPCNHAIYQLGRISKRYIVYCKKGQKLCPYARFQCSYDAYAQIDPAFKEMCQLFKSK